jgi:uncharacterized protein YegL
MAKAKTSNKSKAKTSNKSKTNDKTLVTFLLDKSSSMSLIWDSTISAFNEYLTSLKAESAGLGIDFTLLQFDTSGIEKTCVEVPVKDAPQLSKENYKPTGGTPLIDAAYKTIRAIESSIAKKDTKPKIVVCIQTDGEENSSHEYNWEQLKTLITEKTKEGWQFNFMGTGIDAYDQGAKMGIAAASTISTGMSPAHVQASMRAASASTMRFASGAAMSTAYLSAERTASGDRFAHKAGIAVDDLDLSQTHQPTPKAPTATPIKDFSL